MNLNLLIAKYFQFPLISTSFDYIQSPQQSHTGTFYPSGFYLCLYISEDLHEFL